MGEQVREVAGPRYLLPHYSCAEFDVELCTNILALEAVIKLIFHLT